MNKSFDFNNLILSYIDRIFFYCLKRCNNREDAEDLSQTILTEVIISINNGAKIENFDFYIWSVAKNQYAKYVDRIVKKKDNECDIDNFDSLKVENNILKDIINDEKIRLINQEIKLLSTDYITIIYRFYIEDMTIKHISEELNLPLGTVKRKLYEIRKRLQEAVTLERLNGKKTYIPEDYVFVQSCSNQGTYEPWQYVDTLLNKNLLFHSFNNPCTKEDYSLELGVSMPYIEDIVDELTKVTLLKRENDKYLTNFVFLSRKIQEDIYYIINKYKDILGKDIVDFANKTFESYQNIGFCGSHLSKEKLMWTYLMLIILAIEESGSIRGEYTKRPGNGNWDLLGFENKLNLPFDPYFIGWDYGALPGCIYSRFDIGHRNIFKRKVTRISEYEIEILKYLYGLGNKKIEREKLTEEINNVIDSLIESELIKIVDNHVVFNFTFLNKEEHNKFKKILDSSEFEALVKVYKNLYQEIEDIIKEHIPNYLKNQSNFITSALVGRSRYITIDKAIELNLLDFAMDEKHFTYNFCIIYN